MTAIEMEPGTAAVPAEVEAEVEAAVEAEMGRLVTELGGTLGILLISLGTRSGLWEAMAGAGPLTVEEVGSRVSVDPALVREWLRAQAAGGYLAYDAGAETFTLSEPAEAVLVHGPGGPMVEACLSLLTAMTEGFDDFSAAFGSGAGFGWHQRTDAHWHGVDALTRATIPPELVGTVLETLPDIGRRLAAGGTAVDVGCGYGAPTLAIATLHPQARVLGTDYHDASIMQARAAAGEVGVRNVRFEVSAATELAERDVDLVTFFDSLHDMGDPATALARAREAVAPDGAVLLFEPLGADDVAENLNPAGRMFYAISTLACTPNAVSQRTATSGEPLGAQAGEGLLRELADRAGFASVRRLDVPAPMNLVLELRP